MQSLFVILIFLMMIVGANSGSVTCAACSTACAIGCAFTLFGVVPCIVACVVSSLKAANLGNRRLLRKQYVSYLVLHPYHKVHK